MTRNAMPVEVELNGVRISGFYAVQADMLTVWHAYLGSRTRVIVGDPDPQVVEGLLLELYRAGESRLRILAKLRP
jgi:hypothetical protein